MTDLCPIDRQSRSASERSEQVLDAYKKAFAGFSSEEMLALDGIILEPADRRDG
jgi:hypothetical protein